MSDVEDKLRRSLRGPDWQVPSWPHPRERLERALMEQRSRRLVAVGIAVGIGGVAVTTIVVTALPDKEMVKVAIESEVPRRTDPVEQSGCQPRESTPSALSAQEAERIGAARGILQSVVAGNSDLFLGLYVDQVAWTLVVVLNPDAARGDLREEADRALAPIWPSDVPTRLEVGCRSYADLKAVREQVVARRAEWNPSLIGFAVGIDAQASLVRVSIPLEAAEERRRLTEMFPDLLYFRNQEPSRV